MNFIRPRAIIVMAARAARRGAKVRCGRAGSLAGAGGGFTDIAIRITFSVILRPMPAAPVYFYSLFARRGGGN